MYLLSRHHHFEVFFVVLDHHSAYVHGRTVDRAGEREWRFVLVPDRRPGVGTAHKARSKTYHDCHGKRYLALSNQLVTDINLTAARCARAAWVVHFAGCFKLVA